MHAQFFSGPLFPIYAIENLGFPANGLSWNGIAAGFNLTVKDIPSMYNDKEEQHIHLFPNEYNMFLNLLLD